MRMLFVMDKRDYDPDAKVFRRPSARGIIIKDRKAAMVHNRRYDYYLFPGGGIEQGESKIDALIREVAEESGLRVIPDSVREYGLVRRIQKGRKSDIFIQDNYYYLCEAESETAEPILDGYEAEEGFVLEYVDPHFAVERNRSLTADDDYIIGIAEREARVLESLINDGYF